MTLNHLRIWASLLLLNLSFAATADIFVDRAIVRLAADQPPREDFKVINSDETGYVKLNRNCNPGGRRAR